MKGNFDSGRVLIVGAGPAGVASALFLSKKGIKSILIDKESFPRDKICGDGLSGWVISMLYKLDMGLVEELKEEADSLDSWGIVFYAPNLKHIALPYIFSKRPNEAPGYVIRRKKLDQILINKVKENPLITLIESTQITDFQNTTNGVTLTAKSGKEFKGDIAIFCDGANSKFAINPGDIPKEDKHWATGIKTYYKNVKPRPESQVPESRTEPKASSPTEWEVVPNRAEGELTDRMGGSPRVPPRLLNPVEFYFLHGILPGYLWIFPLPNGEANVGLGIRTDVMKKKKINLKSALFQAIEENPVLKSRLKDAKQIGPIEAWGLPLGSKKRSISGEGFLIAGDAASLIDPFTGEGVGNALNSGFHAAEHISDCFAKSRFDADFNLAYDKRVYDKLWKELRISTAIQKLLMKPALFSWVMNKTVRNSYLQKSFIKMIDNLDERKKLKNPLFYFKVLISRNEDKHLKY